jgi:hypothetical protein
VGIGFSAMGRLAHPDRAFGALLMVQTGLGALVIYGRAWLESNLGVYGVFFVLVAFTGFSACLVPLVGRYQWRSQTGVPSTERMRITAPLVLLLAALFLFQSSANGIWVYLERIGAVAGLGTSEVSGAVAVGTALGIPGALVAIVLGNRYGRLRVLLSGLVLTFGGAALLLEAQPFWRFLAGGGLIGFAWGYALPYLLGSAADIHPSGQGATAGGVASKLGLATGPLIAATLLDTHGFGAAIGASLAGLTLCALAAFLPVSGLDRRRASSPVRAADV